MKCTSIDLNAFFFGELPADERRGVEQHLAACEACRAEHERLRITRTAMQRIQSLPLGRILAAERFILRELRHEALHFGIGGLNLSTFAETIDTASHDGEQQPDDEKDDHDFE